MTDPFAQQLCTHERISCAECKHVPESRTTRALREAAAWVAFAREQGIERLEYEHGEARMVFALGPVPQPVIPEQPPQPDRDVCECGHSLSTEHNAGGCLHGCEVAMCNRTGGRDA